MSLRKAINDKCKSCIHDDLAAGTWRQQVTLCSCPDCPLWDFRPKTPSAIPDSVLDYYGVKGAERAVFQELPKKTSKDKKNLVFPTHGTKNPASEGIKGKNRNLNVPGGLINQCLGQCVPALWAIGRMAEPAFWATTTPPG